MLIFMEGKKKMGANVQATISLKALFNGADVLGGIGKIRKELSNLKLPADLQKSSGTAFDKLLQSLEQYEQKVQQGFKGKGDVTGLDKNINSIITNFRLVEKEMEKVKAEMGDSIDLSKFIKLPPDIANAFTQLQQQIEQAKTNLNDVKTSATNALEGAFQKGGSGFKKLFGDFDTNTRTFTKMALSNLQEVEQALARVQQGAANYLKNPKVNASLVDPTKGIMEAQAKTADGPTANNIAQYQAAIIALENLRAAYERYQTAVNSGDTKLTNYWKTTIEGIQNGITGFQNMRQAAEQNRSAIASAASETAHYNQEFSRLQSQVQYFFGITNAINLFKRSIRSAFKTVKELDKAMTETAVVTDFTVGDMWNKLPRYTKEANKLGATTLGAYQTMTLYYQQGLDTQQAFALGTETMKMARIAGMEYADATNMMTAALRGFNMELNEASAQRVNDVYSELAAITAADTSQIATAMTKTASIAASANMEFETTAAFLSQIIETTQEAPETAGTAMKTIIARFTEVKELYDKGMLSGTDEEGEAIEINKIDKALQSVGLSLKGFLRGEEGIDDIFLQLAEKWDTLDIATQRYIATTAAGSRQQSRFLAMMSDYDRTMELVTAAQNSAGASQTQFEKTLDSLESKLNQLTNAWNEFAMGLMDSGAIKFAVDRLTDLLNIVNKLTSMPGGGILKIALAGMGLGVGGSLVNTGIGMLAGRGAGTAAIETMKAFYGPEQWAGMAAGGAKVNGTALTGAALAREQRKAYGQMLGMRAFGPLWGLPGRIRDNAAKDRLLRYAGGTWQQRQEKVYSAFKTYGMNSPEHLAAIAYRDNSTIPYNYRYSAKEMTQQGLYNSYWGKAGTWLHKKGWGAEGAKGIQALGPKLFGSLGAEAGTAAGALASVGTLLGLIAAAAVTVFATVKAIDNHNISLKEAKIAAENAEQAEAALKKRRDKFSESLKTYNTLQEKANSTQLGSIDNLRTTAELNETVLAMAKENPNLQYTFDAETKQLQLQNAEQVQKQLEQSTQDATVNKLMAQAFVAQKQIEKNERKMSWMKVWYSRIDEGFTGTYNREKQLEYDSLRQQQLTQEANRKAFTQAAAAEIFKDTEFENLGAAMSDKLIEDYQIATEEAVVSNLRGRKYLTDRLIELTGLTEQEILNTYGDGQKLDKKQARIAIQQYSGLEALNEAANEAASALQNLANQGTMSVEQINELNKVAIGDKTVNLDSLKNIDFQGYFDVTEIDPAQFMDSLAKVILEQEAALDIASRSTGFEKVRDNLTREQQLNLGYMAEDLFDLTGSTETFETLSKYFESSASEYAEMFSDINFNNPVKAAKKINDYAESSNKEISYFGQTLQNALITENGPLSQAAQFEYLNETIFSNQEAISDLVDEMGKLDADDVKALADEFSDLNTYLKESGISAATLANIINEININGLNPKLLNDDILKAMDAFNSFTNGMNESFDTWENIDFGKDTGLFFDKIIEGYEQFAEHIINGEIGNQQVEGFYDTLFGAGSWKKILDEKGEEGAKKAVQNLSEAFELSKEAGDLKPIWEHLLSTTEKLDGLVEWNDKLNRLDWIDIEGKTYDDIITSIMEAFNITREYAEALVNDAANASMDLKAVVDEHGIDKAMEILADSQEIIEMSMLQMIADTIGMDVDKLLEGINKRREEKGLGDLQVDTWDNQTFGQALSGAITGQSYDGVEGMAYEAALQRGLSVEHRAGLLTPSLSEDDLQKQVQSWTQENTAGSYASALGIGLNDLPTISLLLDEEAMSDFLDYDGTAEEFLTKLIETDDYIISEAGRDAALQYLTEFQKAFEGEDVLTADLDKLGKYMSESEIFEGLAAQASTALKSGITSFEVSSAELKAWGIEKLPIEITPEMSAADIEAQIDAAVEQAKMEQFAEKITKAFTEIGIDIIFKPEGEEEVEETYAKFKDKDVKINFVPSGLLDTVYNILGIGGEGDGSSATGGIVPSYARGSEQYKLTPGPALTGEEDPEIIWNKERGYAYLAGANGPEYNVLRSGDRVFNASETKKILRNSRRNKRPALASGGYLGGQLTASYGNPHSYRGDFSDWIVRSGTSGNISTGNVDNTGKEDWRNEFDWLYNLMEDIAELERDQNKLQEQYDDYLEDINATAHDLVKVTQAQLSNLYTQLEHQTLAFDKRNQEMREYLEANNKYIEYGTYNFEDQTIEIDWDKIEGIADESLYKEVEEFVNGLEEVQDKIDEADDALIDIQNEIQEIQERFIKEYIDFEKRVIDAMVSERKEQIDALSKINDSLSDTNSRLLDAVQKSLDKQRQDRENTKTEEDIAEKERRLAFLRQDTSGNNQLEIKALEKELGEMKEDYTDELVDQKMTELQEQQDEAAEQRERQIALMESQLEYEQKTGKLWEDMHSLFFDAIGAGGKLDVESALAELLRGQEEWEGMSDTAKQQWLDDLIGEFNSAYAYILSKDINSEQLAKDAYDYTYSDIAPKLPEHSQAKVAFGDKGSGGGSNSDNSPRPEKPKYSASTGRFDGSLTITGDTRKEVLDKIDAYAAVDDPGMEAYWDRLRENFIKATTNPGTYGYTFATGGLADFTGPAWLDGTKSRPELVLNARDTENFIQLKDILSSVLRGGAGSEESPKGDTYIDISVQANLQNDYDTEQLVRKVKSEIYKDGAYRGVNIIHNIR